MAEVYIDVLFAFNFAVDYVIISLTLGIARVKAKGIFIFISALTGAAGACAAFFVPASLSISLKVITVLASGAVAFGRQKPLQYVRLFLLLFCVTFAFGGGIYALCSVFGITRGATGYMDIPIWLFAGVFAVLYFPIKAVYGIYNRRHATEKKTVCAYVTVDGKTFTLRLLSDTGSTLKEPISRRYVMLANGEEIAKSIAEKRKRGALAVPFVSAGNPNGMLLGVFADCVVADGRCLPKTVVAAVDFPLSQNGDFNALISSEALLHI